MNLIERYKQGHTKSVYAEITSMGNAAYEKENAQMVHSVLMETMNRVAYNLSIIHTALQQINYCFNQKPRHDFQYPILKPNWRTNIRIRKLEKAILPLGYMPLSVKMFFSVVGSCNFGWDYESDPQIPWEGADPIQISSVRDLLSEAKDLEPDEEGEFVGLPLSADYYHKDNISGGPPYCIELTAKPQIDSRFFNEEHDTSFINYLRITMENCGFSRAYAVADLPDFIDYCKKVKPLLKPI